MDRRAGGISRLDALRLRGRLALYESSLVDETRQTGQEIQVSRGGRHLDDSAFDIPATQKSRPIASILSVYGLPPPPHASSSSGSNVGVVRGDTGWCNMRRASAAAVSPEAQRSQLSRRTPEIRRSERAEVDAARDRGTNTQQARQQSRVVRFASPQSALESLNALLS
eukprot:TRINITY_DN43090_c0_g1_i1.p1 TRINITY_DN43090_c0_g1~~TRINITY_DN43090_c0_g1_i1.p1  ORF type:complete len:168 (+),score=3.75 TRINITY_DN43090_c0_g1_i1:35-538(+)